MAKVMHGRIPGQHLPERERTSLLPVCGAGSQISFAAWCVKLRNYRFRIRFNPETFLADRRMVVMAVFRTIVVVNDDGNRNFPYLDQNGKRWNLNLNWIDNDLNSNGRIASGQKQ